MDNMYATPAPKDGKKRRGKKLIVCCDGTWMDADKGYVKDSWLPWAPGHLQVPSNVTRIARAICPYSETGRNQIVYYQAGVGTGLTAAAKVLGGATGEGLSENIREAYGFLAHNYQGADEHNEGDKIILIGFSRGAFTARSIAGFIGCVGILTKVGMEDFYNIFKDYEKKWEPDWREEYYKRTPDRPFANRPMISDPAYGEELEKLGFSRFANVKIEAIGVWDTVGSLGIPKVSWLDKLPWSGQANKEYSFHDTTLSNRIEHAFQALALDEKRPPFSPAVWERPGKIETRLLQVWFPGVHCSVGGGNDDQELADITLAWMTSNLEPFVTFDPDYLKLQYEKTKQYEVQKFKAERNWALGLIPNSSTGLMALSGKTIRTPGRYCKADPDTGKPTNIPLENTNEYIHASVRVRLGLKDAKGIDDKNAYLCEALDGWKLKGVDVDGDGVVDAPQAEITWQYKDNSVPPLKEDILKQNELVLLERYEDMAHKVLKIAPASKLAPK